MTSDNAIIICSECFHDQGLRLDAEQLGIIEDSACPSCGKITGHKLNKNHLNILAYRYFVWGSLLKLDYGGAPTVQFNEHQKTDISMPSWLRNDVKLIERHLGVGFFLYGPHPWMLGDITPLRLLKKRGPDKKIIHRIINEYPLRVIEEKDIFYRVRKFPKNPEQRFEYDSPPEDLVGKGRLDSTELPVLYASSDLNICIHECRITAEDDLYVATLSPTSSLRLLDVSALLTHETVAPYESLDLAVNMLFLAGAHSYPLSRKIAMAACYAGFDGLVFPSYFSLLRTGTMPFQTSYGLPNRYFKELHDYEQSRTIPNLALFGRPVKEGKVNVRCINRLILRKVDYGFHFGPVGMS